MAQPPPDWRTQDIKLDRSVYDLAAGVLLVIVAAVIGLALFPDDKGFQGNLYTTILGVLITIFILDRRAERREALRAENDLKARLIREMGSSVNEVAIRAVEELRAKGWLSDGTLEHMKWKNANLQDADLTRATLPYVNLGEANLKKAKFYEANLENACLWSANLQESNLRVVYLYNSDLWGAYLQNADLTGSYLKKANLRAVNLQQANLCAVTLTASNLTDAHLEGAILYDYQIDETTILPDGTNWTAETDMSRFTNANHPQFWRSNNPNSPAFSHR